jgi:hypothetical protein
MDATAKERSARWRERRRRGIIPVTVDVVSMHRRALESIGLIRAGYDRDPEAVAWAVARFLNTAPAVQAIGEALYPDWPKDDDEAESDTPSPENNGQNQQ